MYKKEKEVVFESERLEEVLLKFKFKDYCRYKCFLLFVQYRFCKFKIGVNFLVRSLVVKSFDE